MSPEEDRLNSLMGELSDRGYENSNSVEPNEKNFPGGYEDTELQIVHFSKEEAITFDAIQNPQGDGQPFIDDESLLRSYEPMGNLIKEPHFRDLFLNAAIEEETPRADMPDFKHMELVGEEIAKEIPWMPAPGDDNPEIKKLANEGEHEDSIVVLMPTNMVYLLGQAKGVVNINPKTGFVEFAWLKKFLRNPGRAVSDTARRPGNLFKETIRIGATILGAMAGGPLGGALANTAAQVATGRKFGDALGHGAKAGLATWGVQGLQSMAPSMANSGFPGFAQMGQGLQSMPQIPGFSQGMANMGMGNLMGGGGASAATAPGFMQGGLPSNVAGVGATAPAGYQAASSSGSLFSSPLVQLGLPTALAIGSGIMAKKGDKEQYKLSKEEQLAQMRHQDERDEAYRRRSGYYEPLKMNDIKKVINPRYGEPGEPYYIYDTDSRFEDKRRGAYSSGGKVKEEKPKGSYDRFNDKMKKKILHKDSVKSGYLLKGPGDGISDSIHTKVPENTFIVNAKTVAMIGKGDSNAGAKSIREWLDTYEKKYSPSMLENIDYIENGEYDVPVALSAGEVPILPSHIYMIGEGVLKKGIEVLEKLHKNVDKHVFKKSSPLKSIEEYLKT